MLACPLNGHWRRPDGRKMWEEKNLLQRQFSKRCSDFRGGGGNSHFTCALSLFQGRFCAFENRYRDRAERET